ncbi:HEPN domain-containing protein [Chitinophaga pinensis]|uniref:Sulfite reductase (Ferredoxin) n=1 Tax=Chitinophaga pinensis (strain ATCC 43595 / DSM 2588 / LMG 13176 / NBRC 15968 / NCIMB 11800 / UQM 2034) TaxID=485918 RepID=A0A979GB50_CHIPD|nr:HEPN domain-containing protein [Chitinophaga pinensis]ACU64021.1 Sulfite reductase (ferredoxin) [Chitinophaga pinensis DSM 2588]
MQSFRTELENPVVERDIIELEKKIRLFREGQIPEEKFRSLRLARGIYGQRQPGVQMIRIKLPYGKMTLEQWKRISDVSDEFSTGNLHLTTRQDVQIHFVSLDRTPELWSKLDLDDITIREACGNTVRNITASDRAGIDPQEPFDVTPYADATFRYFLRNPICQDMGRKIKMSFSSSDADTAWSFMHDMGAIPKVRIVNGEEVRGFKVLVGGGLGAQPYLAHVAHEFLEADQLIPYIESVLRVFDRHGERASRHKARMKFLVQKLGFEEFSRLVAEERIANKVKSYPIDAEAWPDVELPAADVTLPAYTIKDAQKYEAWKATNAFRQRQADYYAAYVRVPLGNISSVISRQLVEALRPAVANDVRVTANQGLLLKYIQPAHLPYVFSVLETAGFAEPGFDSIADITACPGTDTCNLAISSSTGISTALELVIAEEFPDLVYNKDIKIKISGCMNSCGQHGIASIGFHGSSLKSGGKVLPALQVLLGGGIVGDGVGRVADKVIKVPSKRGPDVLRTLLRDYEANAQQHEKFNEYYDRQGEKYFYDLLKPLTDLGTLEDEDFVDWGQGDKFATAIGVGECASVVIDLVATLLFEGEEKLQSGKIALDEKQYADGIYHSYSTFVQTAKALLLGEGVSCNTQTGIINDFDKHFVETGKWPLDGSFKTLVLQINQNEPSESFAKEYYQQAADFYQQAHAFRNQAAAVTAQ